MDQEVDVSDTGPSIVEYNIPKNYELRMECNGSTKVTIKLINGSAEVFGAELHKGQTINVTGQKLAVYTWTGCKLIVEGKPAVIYEADETPVASYLNVHAILNARRQEAQSSEREGPRCIVVGPTDSGKSTLCKMLANWAVRTGFQPTMVDLDIGQGSITAPGCIAATPLEAPISIEEGYPVEMPLVYFYGHASANDNPELYKFLIDRLASQLDRRSTANSQAAASGLIINTLGWIDGLGYELQLHAIQALKADVVIVMEQDRLYSQLANELKGKAVIKLTKSGGVVKRERDERRVARDQRIKEYFYGAKGDLLPVSQTVRTDQLMVYRIGGGPRAPNSALPIGAVSVADPLRLANLPVTAELMQSLVAVSHAPTADLILSTNVAGFILIKDIDTARGLVTYTAPCPGPLPGRYLVTGSLRSNIE